MNPFSPMSKIIPEVLTVAEVAEALRVAKMTVYRLIHAKELQTVKVGRSFRILRPSLEAYLKRTES